MRILIVVLSSVVMTMASMAQSRVGVKAGLNTYRFEEPGLAVSSGSSTITIRPQQNDLGVNLGIYALVRAKHFYVQPEAIYNSWQTTFLIDSQGGSAEDFREERYQFLDIPITFGFRMGFFRLGGGVVGHINLSSSGDVVNLSGYEARFEPVTLGYQAGLGFDLWSITIDLRYEGNFDRFGYHMYFNDEPIEWQSTPSRIIGTIGIHF